MTAPNSSPTARVPARPAQLLPCEDRMTGQDAHGDPAEIEVRGQVMLRQVGGAAPAVTTTTGGDLYLVPCVAQGGGERDQG